MKSNDSIFWVKYNGIMIPATKNLIHGEKLHDEELSYLNDIELRSWNPFHCSLSSAIMCGLELLPIIKNSNILYYGNKISITISHISDLIDENGNITCIIPSDFLNYSDLKNRKNIIFKNSLKELSSELFDTIFIDTCENITLESIIDLFEKYLKPDGFVMILISKSNDTHLKTLLSDYRKHFKIIQNIDLGIYQKNQSLLIGQK